MINYFEYIRAFSFDFCSGACVLVGSYCLFIAITGRKRFPGHMEVCFMYTYTDWVLNYGTMV